MVSSSIDQQFRGFREEIKGLKNEITTLNSRIAELEHENARLKERGREVEAAPHKTTHKHDLYVSPSPPRSLDDEEEWLLWTGTMTSDNGVEPDSEDSNTISIPEHPRVLKRKFNEEADDTNDRPIDVGDKHKEDTESAESKHNEPDTCRVPQTDPPVVINTLDSSSFVPTTTLATTVSSVRGGFGGGIRGRGRGGPVQSIALRRPKRVEHHPEIKLGNKRQRR